jgi:hypothetical protein
MWRYTTLTPKLLFFDARLVFTVILFVVQISWLTFLLIVLAVTILTLLERRGISVEDALRGLRVVLGSVPTRRILMRRFIDHG